MVKFVRLCELHSGRSLKNSGQSSSDICVFIFDSHDYLHDKMLQALGVSASFYAILQHYLCM